LCAGCSTTLSSATTGGSWSSSNTAAATIGAGTGVVSGVGTGTTTISYVASGCAVTAVVTVTPATSPSTGTPVVCVGQTNATLSNPISGGTWSSSNSSIATVHAVTGLLTGVGAGNANITYTTSPGTYTIIVATVSPALAMNVGTTSICPQTTSSLTNASGGGTWSSSNSLIASINSGTGVMTGVASGSTNVSYVVNVGCYRVSAITIKSQPNIIGGATSVPVGGTRILNASPGGGAWSSASPAIATATGSGVGTITGVSLGVTTVTYTNSVYFGGCFRTRSMTVSPARPGSPVVSEAVQASVLKVFPNPTSGTLTIDAPVAGTFTVYTIDGKQVAQYTVAASANMVTLPSNLAAGIYMCRFVGTEGTYAIVRLVFER
jgi:trimeric autotransporter adhesin